MAWQPLTARQGQPSAGGPHEGVPQHLHQPIRHWLDGAFGCPSGHFSSLSARTTTMLAVAATCRIPLTAAARDSQLYGEIVRFCRSDSDQFLDVVHATIQLTQEYWPVDPLEQMLVCGGSAWRATKTGLQRRVDPVAQEAFDNATRTQDVASEELQHAWIKAYGREPDASDAWDHAIKAVEAILIDTVVPNQHDPTLGHVIGHLASQGHLWTLVLPGPNNDYSVAPLVTMLRMLWPNPDRHASPQHRRTPSLEEAQAVVHLAVTIVQWGRDGQILKK